MIFSRTRHTIGGAFVIAVGLMAALVASSLPASTPVGAATNPTATAGARRTPTPTAHARAKGTPTATPGIRVVPTATPNPATRATLGFKPVLLVVDLNIAASGLSEMDAINRGSAYLPLLISPPSYRPSGVSLFSVSVQKPFHGVTPGAATLSYGSLTSGQAFQVDERPAPFVYGKAKATLITIGGRPGVFYDLGSSGKVHLVALTWSIGSHYFEITSNVGRSKLSTSTLIQVANSIH